MADPYYGPGGTGYYTDPATGKRYFQVRYQQGPDGYDPNASAQDSRLTYDPGGGPTYGAGATNAQTGSGISNGTTTPGTTPGTSNPGALGANDASAKATIQTLLDGYGLGSLADWYWSKYLAGEPDAQIMIELRQTPEYKQRFPGMADLAAKGRAISEADYINIEQQYVSLFRQSGLPAGFYDQPSDFAKFIGEEVSPSEMGARLDVARTALYQTPPEVRDELARLYGLGSGDVMAFLLDPTKALPIIQNQFTAATAAAAGKMSGYGLLTVNEAEQLGSTGRTFDQFTQGFDYLGRAQELFNPIIGENGESFSREDQLSAVFQGNTAAQRRLERRAQERKAAFAGGGGYAATNAGVTGLGSASS